MSFNAFIRWRHRRTGFNPPRPMLRPTVGSGLVISWAGMRGIVSLAAALALPLGFPSRNLIVLTAFSVVLGTLIIQGLTLKPLLRALKLDDDDPVGQEVRTARARALKAGLASWFLASVLSVMLSVQGVMPLGVMIITTLVLLVEYPIAVGIGAKFYSEGGA
jgi:hypothetical protein